MGAFCVGNVLAAFSDIIIGTQRKRSNHLSQPKIEGSGNAMASPKGPVSDLSSRHAFNNCNEMEAENVLSPRFKRNRSLIMVAFLSRPSFGTLRERLVLLDGALEERLELTYRFYRETRRSQVQDRLTSLPRQTRMLAKLVIRKARCRT